MLFRLSYLYFNVVGCLTVIVVGLVTSFITGAHRAGDINPDLLSPVIHWMLPKKEKHDYTPVKQMSNEIKTAQN